MPASRQVSPQPRRAPQRPSSADASSPGLLEILQEQQATVKDLLAMAQQKHDYILQRQPSQLAELVSQETETAHRLARLEEARRLWGSRLGLDPDGSLETWLEHLPPAEREAITREARQLRQLASSLAAQNALNQALLQQEMAYIEFAVNMLRGPDPADLTYGPPGSQGTAAAAPGTGGPGAPGTGSSSPQGAGSPGAGSQGLGRSLFDFQA